MGYGPLTMRIAGYDTHPAADLFPMMGGPELTALADDIKKHGQHNSITLYVENGEQLVLDGRNRLAACELAGVAPTTELWTGEGSPVSWVVSQNLHRRQLTASQRAMVAAGLVPMFEAEARDRDQAGKFARMDEPSGRARDKAASAVNVSPRSVESALKVTREAPANVVGAVRAGIVSVSAAEKKLRKPPKENKDHLISLILILPRSRLTPTQDRLMAMGFKRAGSRKMKFTDKGTP
jgi:hypothetical protein